MRLDPPGTILLTGATGYIGGRLLRRLQETDRQVRCLTRRPEVLAGRIAPATRVVVGDLLDRDSLEIARRSRRDASRASENGFMMPGWVSG
jgi:uncharacterized protein YbjT (DUF2867 family)